jgi:N-carbamoyl-L-amino-acid hydrolase
MKPSEIRVNGERLWESLMAIAEIGPLPGGGSCRLALTDEDRAARDLFATWCREASCEVRVDQGGNMFAVRRGRHEGPAVAAGSHLDTQPHGGRFDGIFGVLAALEVVRTLEDRGIETERPTAVVNWTNEEGVRFASGLIGSSAFAGDIGLEALHNDVSIDGKRFGDELARIGYLGDLPLGKFAMHAYFEPHIEQGPILEGAGQVIGIVTHVQGLRWFEVEVTGADRHAGSTPMAGRKDSLVAASRLVGALNELGLAHAPDARITVGRLEVEPNSPSTIPGRTRFNIDLRHPEMAMLDRLEQEIGRLCEKGKAGGFEIALHRKFALPPTVFDQGCVEDVARAVARLGYSYRRMSSGGLHDACSIAAQVPCAMLFIPSRDGISHNEAEWSEPEHVEAGANVLLHAMLARAG